MPEEVNIKKEYESLKKKYKELPDFEKIDNEFELTTIEKSDFLARRIRRKVGEKVVFFCRILENIIYPSMQNAMGVYEAGFFSDDEKEKLTKIHRELMSLERSSLLLEVECRDEEEDIVYIKTTFEKWFDFKKEIIEIVTKMKEVWKKEVKEDNEKYFG